MDPAERLAVHAEARRRWLLGEHVNMIAAKLSVQPDTIWYWKRLEYWPERPFRRWNYTPITADIVALGHKLWTEDKLPRVDIANLLGIGLSTLNYMRRDYDWPKRKPGRCGVPEWEAIYRRTRHDKQARSRMRAIRARRFLRKPKEITVKWWCCGKLHTSTTACPECGRPNPLCA